MTTRLKFLFFLIKKVSRGKQFTALHICVNICVYKLSEAVDISQSATSHQLAYLEARGIVKSVRSVFLPYTKRRSYLSAFINLI
jgi:DNA-binding transcriptional ArsR family regulator